MTSNPKYFVLLTGLYELTRAGLTLAADGRKTIETSLGARFPITEQASQRLTTQQRTPHDL